ncbi:MAG TPA: hypothetical protein VGL86_26565 [Polyangia bacterium]|jgi:hypothetical protein
MRWTLAVATAAALVAAAGACGSVIAVPDQGVIVTGCQEPGQCIRADCSCSRSLAGCVVSCVQTNPTDPSTCYCMGIPMPTPQDMNTQLAVECLEPSMACIGRGVFCGGVGATCQATGTTCDGSGDPPQLIPAMGMPALEPHCQFLDDVCCPGTSPSDGGVMTD